MSVYGHRRVLMGRAMLPATRENGTDEGPNNSICMVIRVKHGLGQSQNLWVK